MELAQCVSPIVYDRANAKKTDIINPAIHAGIGDSYSSGCRQKRGVNKNEEVLR